MAAESFPGRSHALGEWLDASPVLAECLRGIDRAAASDAPVLVLGESGTGRSRLARALHQASPRRTEPLVEVDPGAVPTTLFESELFGYRPGAFTGAETATTGRVTLAEGGTLVLDHIEELPATVQPKLLRFLAERRFTPLGGREREADVRIIAIGSKDLRQRVERGTFRGDLFYRLEVLAFELPPLRDRLAELPDLCDVLLDDLAHRFGRRRPRLRSRDLDWMGRYGWPGNLRQLRNLLERAMVVEEGKVLALEPPVDAVEGPPRTLRQVEDETIRRALAFTRGHQGRAAELLGISRKALWEKRRRLGIP